MVFFPEFVQLPFTLRIEHTNLRHAAECHRQVRRYVKKTVRPGMSMIEIANLIENGTRNILGDNGTNGFVTSANLSPAVLDSPPG
jgi:methionyl aminopeptidase